MTRRAGEPSEVAGRVPTDSQWKNLPEERSKGVGKLQSCGQLMSEKTHTLKGEVEREGKG
jgi:hypothetical protein